MTSSPTVWVLVHDLGRTGVPVVLARLLSALPGSDHDVHVVAIRGGPLEASVRLGAATVTTLEPEHRRSVTDAVTLGLQGVGLQGPGSAVRRAAWRRRVQHLPQPDVVVLHGAGAWPLLEVVGAKVPVVLHLHELETGLDRSVPLPQQASLMAVASKVLAVSRPVADLAVARGAPPGRIELLPGVVDLDDVQGAGPTDGHQPSGVQLGRPVMGAGVVGWRKGTDRLAAVAFELERAGRADEVGWVGGRPSGADTTYVGAPDPVLWCPPRPDPWTVLDAAEVIVVPSREDPLPLVALEAGLRRKAVVAMPTGGLPELLSHGRGRAVSGQDVVEFSLAVREMLEDPDGATAAGEALFDHVVAHHDAAVVAPRWWDLVTSSI